MCLSWESECLESCTRPEFATQCPYNGSQPSVSSFQGTGCPFLTSAGTACSYPQADTYTYQNT